MPLFASDAKMFEIRGYDIERFVPEYVYEMIDKAARHNINAIGLSHAICMNAEEIIYDWHRYQYLQQFCEYAHKRGMKVYLWTHEVNGPVDKWVIAKDGHSVLKADEPELYEWIARKYEQACDRVPSCDGFILSLTESKFHVHRDNKVISNATPAERMARVINAVREGCAAKGKRLIVRDFLRTPAEMAAFVEALKSVPDDVWVYTKCVPNDWEFKYPTHPLLGKVAPHKQIMEMDLATEAGGITRWPMCIPEYIQTMVKLARDRGLAGVIPRCDDTYATNAGTPNEINIYAYSILINNPDADVNKIWKDYCIKRYGDKAGPVAEKVLRRSFEITCALQYTLGFWTGSGAKMASVEYADGHLINNSNATWDPSPENKRIEKMLLDGGPEAIKVTVREKEEAEELSQQCLDELDAAKALFTKADYDQLRGYYERTLRDAVVGRHWAQTYFALRWYRNTKSPEAKRELDAALVSLKAHKEKLDKSGVEWDSGAAERFIAEVEEILGYRG